MPVRFLNPNSIGTFMVIYRCSICNHEFDEDKSKKKFADLTKCPSCGAKKSNLKEARDLLDEAIQKLKDYRNGTPEQEFEIED